MRKVLRWLLVLPFAFLLPCGDSAAEPGEVMQSELRIDAMAVRVPRSYRTGRPPRFLLRLKARFQAEAGSSFDPQQDDFQFELFDTVWFYSPLELSLPSGSPGWSAGGSGRFLRWTSGPRGYEATSTRVTIDRVRGTLAVTILPVLPSLTGEAHGSMLQNGFDAFNYYIPRGGSLLASVNMGSMAAGGECFLSDSGDGRWDYRLRRGRGGPEANERRAVATLREILEAQRRVKEQAAIDVDGDGIGEYGTLAELAGLAGVRAGLISGYPMGADFSAQGPPVRPPLLERPFGAIDYNGFSIRDGYAFMVFLPSRQVPAKFASAYGPAAFIGVLNYYGPESGIGVDESENTWCAYAQPIQYAGSGFHKFFVNQDGVLLESANNTAKYQGVNTPMEGNSAFRGAGITSSPAMGLHGNDGDYWFPIETKR